MQPATVSPDARSGKGRTSGTAIEGHVATAGAGHNVITGVDGNFATVFALDDFGNVHITGSIYTAGGCNAGCISTKRVVSYAPRPYRIVAHPYGETAARLPVVDANARSPHALR